MADMIFAENHVQLWQISKKKAQSYGRKALI